MAINKKLIHFRNKQNFENEVANGNILDTSIVFIQDSKEISTHGTLYKTVNWSVLEEANPSINYEYVDLGLPSGLKWAKYNVGATSPEEYGNYYAWGETTTKSDYSSSTSITYGLSISELESRGIIDTNGNLTAAYDAATANWGDEWRMPTLDETKELINQCTWEWTTQYGVNGYNVIGPNGNSIFLPAAGNQYGTSIYDTRIRGMYWSATVFSNITNNKTYGYDIYFNSSGSYKSELDDLYRGNIVRPVINLNN